MTKNTLAIRLIAVAAVSGLTCLGMVMSGTASATGANEVTGARSAQTFEIDNVHTSVIFRIKHKGVSYFYGRFNQTSGTFTLDESEPTNASFDIEVVAESVDTAAEGRDRHLKGPDFFDAKQFPTIAFKSTNVETGDSANTLRVTGDLSLHGVTKEITVDVDVVGTAEGRRGTLGGVETEFTIKRSDYGMTTYIEGGGLGDEVTLMISLEGGVNQAQDN